MRLDRHLLLLVIMGIAAPGVWACPLCKEAVSRGSSALAKGYNWSILLMLGVPVIVVGVISGVVYKATRQGNAPRQN